MAAWQGKASKQAERMSSVAGKAMVEAKRKYDPRVAVKRFLHAALTNRSEDEGKGSKID